MWVLIIVLGAFAILGSSVLRAAERWSSQPWDRRTRHGKAGAAS
jgi:hypothetical protein